MRMLQASLQSGDASITQAGTSKNDLIFFSYSGSVLGDTSIMSCSQVGRALLSGLLDHVDVYIEVPAEMLLEALFLRNYSLRNSNAAPVRQVRMCSMSC